MSHVDLWSELWDRQMLLGDSVSIQWVPSRAAKGASISLQPVSVHKAITDIRADLGLEEMPHEKNGLRCVWGFHDF